MPQQDRIVILGRRFTVDQGYEWDRMVEQKLGHAQWLARIVQVDAQNDVLALGTRPGERMVQNLPLELIVSRHESVLAAIYGGERRDEEHDQ